MHSELIDLLYENDAVEGVALFHDSGKLVENQLAISETSVNQIFLCLNDIKQGLADASRTMQGFLIKNSKYLLQAFIHGDLILLLQVGANFSPEKTYQSLRSQLGVSSTPEDGVSREKSQEAEQEVVEKLEVEEVDSSPKIDWAEFQQKISSLVKRVAPSGVAKSMISTAIKDAGVSEEASELSAETAFDIGSAVLAKIPNASRRKIIEKEYQLLISKYQQ